MRKNLCFVNQKRTQTEKEHYCFLRDLCAISSPLVAGKWNVQELPSYPCIQLKKSRG